MSDEAEGDATSVAASDGPVSASRLKAFVDAVVAIAMTLLILPLLDSIGDAATTGLSTGEWLREDGSSLFAFVLSFAVIASFWVNHHQLFARVERVTSGLLWITILWMLTIVWLPVATALVGQLEADPLQKAVYIGTMVLSSAIAMLTRGYLRSHAELHTFSVSHMRREFAADAVSPVLFALCLFVALMLPAVGYWAMLLMVGVGPGERLAKRWSDRGQGRDQADVLD